MSNVADATQVSVAIDVGGTFTDVVGVVSDGRLLIAKVSSTPADPSQGVIQGLAKLLEANGLAAAQITRFIHGTTVATNAVIEQKGAVTGLLTTEGFEDVLTVGRQKRSELYNLFIDQETPDFLVPRRRRCGIPERIDSQGQVLVPLDEQAVRDAVQALVEQHRVQAIAVVYLFSFLAPAHERRTKQIIETEFPDIAVSISCEIDPTFREYERTLVTTFDAYLRPKVASYVDALERELEAFGIGADLEVMQSRGGIASAGSAVARPVSLLRSGPAAGVIAARMVGEICSELNIISNDIGGTTADIGVIVGGKPLTSTEGRVLRYPVRIPMIDVSSIGAGGGSIAWLDEAHSLHVGPRSAGAVPGPICYGAAGDEPTVTDASVVLGYLNPDHLVGGELTLDPDAAHRAMETLGRQLGLDRFEVAAGIHTILNNHMADEIRLLTVKRGFDPREFALVLLGGAGPLHGGALARALGIPKAIIPLAPGVLSAFGLLVSDIEHDHALSFARQATDVTCRELEDAFAQLDARGAEDLRRDRVDPSAAAVRRYADVRYVGQSYELEVEISGGFDAGVMDRLVQEFHREHQRIYKQHNAQSLVELVNLRAVVYVSRQAPAFEAPPRGSSWQAAQIATRQAYFGAAPVEVPVFRRELLPHGDPREGPFVVEQVDSTSVVLPGDTAHVEPSGNLVIAMPHDG